MRSLLKLTLLVAAVLCFSSQVAQAQKFGYINYSELLMGMPEREEATVKFQQFTKELEEQLETIQVEFNTKYQDYQQNMETMSESVRQLREKELSDLNRRFEEFQEVAQQDMQRMEQQLMEPIMTKAQEAIDKVAKSNGFAMIFDDSRDGVYMDESVITNILPLVKSELGIN